MVSIHQLSHMTRENWIADSPIRVIIADYYPIVRAGIAQEIGQQELIHVVGEAADTDAVLASIQDLMPDVLIVDIKMLCLNAFAGLHTITALPHAPNILIVTDSTDLAHLLTAIKSGVRGYIFKNEPPAIISRAVYGIARGEIHMSPEVTHRLVEYMGQHQHEAPDVARPCFQDPARDPQLSAREQDVLHLLSDGRENQEIGQLLSISERTVRYHLRNIYDKIGVRRRSEAIVWSIRQGFGRDTP